MIIYANNWYSECAKILTLLKLTHGPALQLRAWKHPYYFSKVYYFGLCFLLKVKVPVNFKLKKQNKIYQPAWVGSVVQWLECWDCDPHGLSSKLTRAILLCPWKRLFTALSPAWWFWQAL